MTEIITCYRKQRSIEVAILKSDRSQCHRFAAFVFICSRFDGDSEGRGQREFYCRVKGNSVQLNTVGKSIGTTP